MHSFRGFTWSPAPAGPQIGRCRARQYCASGTMKCLSKIRFTGGARPGSFFRIVFYKAARRNLCWKRAQHCRRQSSHLGALYLAVHRHSRPTGASSLLILGDAVSRGTCYARTLQLLPHPSPWITARAGRLDLDDRGSSGSAIQDRSGRIRNGNRIDVPTCAASSACAAVQSTSAVSSYNEKRAKGKRCK